MDSGEISSSVASLLLISLEDRLYQMQKNSDVNEKPDVECMMKQVFLKAGIALTSSTALEVHSKMFREIFITQSTKSISDSLSTSSNERVAPQFSVLQYFALLRSEGLGWLQFHNELMPYLRISDATKVLIGLADYYREKACGELNLTDIKLLLSGLTAMLGIFLDLLASDRSDDPKEHSSLPVQKQNQEEKIDSLLKLGTQCLEAMLRTLQQHDILPELMKDCGLLKETLEVLSLVLILLGPYINAEQVKLSLLRVYKGKLYFTNFKEKFTKKNDKLRKKEQFKEFKEKSYLINFTESKESSSNLILKKETEDGKSNESKSSNSNESKASTFLTIGKGDKPTLSELVILRFRSNISVALFCDISRFICRGELEENRAFYDFFSDFLCSEQKVCINKHLLDGHSFRLLLVEALAKFDKLKNDVALEPQGAACSQNSEKQNFLDATGDSHIQSEPLFSSGCAVSGNVETEPLHQVMVSDLVGALSSIEGNINKDSINENSLLYKLGKLLAERPASLPRKLLDISQLKMSDVDHLVKTERDLYGEEDLNLVKKAVNERTCGWRDLLARGLRNKDFKGWWNAGFYDLVWKHEAVLSSETNVAHVLSFLQTLSEQDTRTEDSVSAMTKLFSVMFRRLPTLIQEHLVSSVLSSCEHSVVSAEQEESVQVKGRINLKPPLSKLKTEQQILSELTSTLNRLTMSNLREMMPQLLELCLYHPNAVISQGLSVAVENKGQVASIVEMLRLMPAVCEITNPNHQSLISQCLCDVLMETELSEVRNQNIIKLITLLTQDYTQSMDPWSKELRQLMAVLPLREFLLHVLIPSLDGQTWCSDQEENKKRDILPLHVSLSVLASVLNSTACIKLEMLQPLILLHHLIAVHVSSYQVIVDGQLDQLKLAEKQSSLQCIELLISALSSENGLLEGSGYRWLGQQAMKGGLLATVLAYPLLKTHCDLEMKTLLEEMVDIMNSSPEKSAQIMVNLAQLALANDEVCAEVVEVVGNMTQALDGTWAVALTSHLLMTSFSCQAPRVGRLLLAAVQNSYLCFQTSEEFDLYPTEFSFSNKGSQLIKVNQVLSASVLHLMNWGFTETSLVHIMSNYQSCSQVLLSDLPSGVEGSQVLEQYFSHYCLLLSGLEGRSAHVLQVSSLDVLTKLKNLQSSKRKAKESSKNAGMKDGDFETFEKGVDLKLIDFVACVKEESVKTQLMKQVRGLKL